MKAWALILDAVERHGRSALVSVIATKGSAPRDAGSHMVVTPEGYLGTIGGGTLEWRAMATAQSLLSGRPQIQVSSHALGPELGQCCGGQVKLATQIFDRSSLPMLRDLAAREVHGPFELRDRIPALGITEVFGEQRRVVYLFGAGHVGRALVLALAPLPFDVIWIDSRPNAFPAAVPGNVTLIHSGDPPLEVASASHGSIAMVMTHSHALDLAVTAAALNSEALAHVGLIGSTTKRARFEKRLAEVGIAPARIASLICPIGLPGLKSKEPAIIAAATAAQLIVLDESLRAAELEAARPQARAGGQR
jgi:xanthine dehydrogenase accessory factor